MATGSENGEIQLWNTGTGASVGPVLRNRYAVKRLRFSPDGNRLLAAGGPPGSIQGEAQVWLIANGQPAGPALDIVGEVQDATFTADGKGFITGAFDLVLWNAETSERIWTAPTLGVTTELELSSDGQRLAAAVQEENAVVILDARTGQPICAPLRHEDVVRAFDLSPDGKLVLSYSEDRSARLWHVDTGLALGPPWMNLQGGGSGSFVNERSCLLLDGEAIARWTVPAEMEGTPDLIELAIQAATRCRLNPHGNVMPLIPRILPGSSQQRPLKFGPDPYLPVWEQLQSKGGAPGLLRR